MNPASLSVWPRGLAALAAALALVTGCGGGVGEGGTGGGYTLGTISGLGSIIVNGVRYDDSAAAVTDVDGTPRSAAVLGLGMSVEVESGPVGSTGGRPEATATAVRYASEIVGPVAAIDNAGGRLTVLGQAVLVDDNTVYGAPLAGLATLAVGQVLEIHAEPNVANGTYRATRLDLRRDADTPAWRLRGVVTTRDTPARRFTIGTAAFDAAAVPPAGVVVGRIVRVTLAKTAADSALWTVDGLVDGQRTLPDGRDATINGLVTEVQAQPQFFSVNGQAVNAAGLTLPSGIAVGARVEVTGKITGNALRATRVTVLAGASAAPLGDIELNGAVSDLDTAAKTFSVRGTGVSYGRNDVRYEDGTAADLAPGRRVRVHGTLLPGGRRVEARRIEFDR
jgi:Domain of unknown function (DUF5666)